MISLSLIQKSCRESDDYAIFKYDLRGKTDSTHSVKRFSCSDVVLYNLNAVGNVHPIFHEHFFGRDMSGIENYYQGYGYWKKFADLLFHYYIYNNVFNATVYYFCYEKYDQDEENDEEDDEESHEEDLTNNTETGIKNIVINVIMK